MLVTPSLCQPNGDAAVFWGLVSVSKPRVISCLVIGSTRYLIERPLVSALSIKELIDPTDA